MDRPVAMKSNLHSVLFETRSTRLWVANASKDGAPAVTQPFHAFTFTELLAHEPSSAARQLPPPPSGASAPADAESRASSGGR